MSTWIDWHSHHTAPEVAQRITQFTGREPHIDQFDSLDFSQRVKEIDSLELLSDPQLGLAKIHLALLPRAGLKTDQASAEMQFNCSLIAS